MNRREQSQHQACRRAQGVLDGEVLKGNERIAAARLPLDGVTAAVAESAAVQAQARDEARGLTASIRAQRQILRELHMRPIIHTARAVLHPEHPRAATAQFRMPEANGPVELLIASADALAKEAAPYLDKLTAAGLSPDCIDQLLEEAGRLRVLVDDQAGHIGRAVSATKSLQRFSAASRRTLLVVDAVVQQQAAGLPDGPRVLDEWRKAIRVTAPPSSRATPADAPEEAPATAAAALPNVPVAAGVPAETAVLARRFPRPRAARPRNAGR